MKKRLAAFWNLLRGMQRRIDRAQLPLVAAGGAFFAMLSLFPGLAAVIAVLGIISDPIIVDQQLVMLKDFMPAPAFNILETQVMRLIESNTSTLGWATFLSTGAALWSARRGTDAMIQALNSVYGVPQRGGVWPAIMALGLTVALIGVVVIAMVGLVILPVVLAFLPLGPWTGLAVNTTRWAASLLVVFIGIWLFYRFSPNRQGHRVRFWSLGTFLSVVVWALASAGFSYYLSNFGSYNEIYGSIGAVIALMMLLYISILAVLLGATLNAELDAMKAAAEGDRTAESLPEPSGLAAGRSEALAES
ncbi:MAG: YihY/virulence factor BrkB family protein [Pseudomonadota bacterium]